MNVLKTSFEGLLIIEPDIFGDSRGYFFESYIKRKYQDAGVSMDFVQDNQSQSQKNVIRGLHFQKPPHAQTKLIRVLSGTILDVVVDLRKDQPTFKKSFSLELSAENKIQLLIPKGFAHGFSVLSEEAEIFYKCDDYYYPELEGGILYDDIELAIDWKVSSSESIVSAKDKGLPGLLKSDLSFF